MMEPKHIEEFRKRILSVDKRIEGLIKCKAGYERHLKKLIKAHNRKSQLEAMPVCKKQRIISSKRKVEIIHVDSNSTKLTINNERITLKIGHNYRDSDFKEFLVVLDNNVYPLEYTVRGAFLDNKPEYNSYVVNMRSENRKIKFKIQYVKTENNIIFTADTEKE